MDNQSFKVRVANWEDDFASLRLVREQVFVQEQQVSQEEEWDDADPKALHVLAEDRAGNPVGTGRLLKSGQIGRMAVLAPWRSSGVGSALLKTLILHAVSIKTSPFLNAQTQALHFYQRHGFTSDGEIFMEADIPHIRMEYSQGC
ncbi:MAG: GNAT family N-acetyltransferase [Gammaproteobacteria bacterium]|nr:GNAT family N-acetyltransferase [Gammaproteobacteria bacterium]